MLPPHRPPWGGPGVRPRGAAGPTWPHSPVPIQGLLQGFRCQRFIPIRLRRAATPLLAPRDKNGSVCTALCGAASHRLPRVPCRHGASHPSARISRVCGHQVQPPAPGASCAAPHMGPSLLWGSQHVYLGVSSQPSLKYPTCSSHEDVKRGPMLLGGRQKGLLSPDTPHVSPPALSHLAEEQNAAGTGGRGCGCFPRAAVAEICGAQLAPPPRPTPGPITTPWALPLPGSPRAASPALIPGLAARPAAFVGTGVPALPKFPSPALSGMLRPQCCRERGR